jgi:hypothetical protein
VPSTIIGPLAAEVAVAGIVTGWWAFAAESGVRKVANMKISIRI